jgi:rare lipoprotein A
VYDMNQMTAAHRTMPFGTWVLVESQLTGRTAEVRITDRGPFVDDRILDLSAAAARVLGAIGPGTIPVRLRVIRLAGSGPGPAAGGTPAAAFAVQLAAFGAADRAHALRDELTRKGIEPAYVQPANLGGAVFYRVRVGPYAKRAAADARARELAGAGYAVLVVGE